MAKKRYLDIRRAPLAVKQAAMRERWARKGGEMRHACRRLVATFADGTGLREVTVASVGGATAILLRSDLPTLNPAAR